MPDMSSEGAAYSEVLDRFWQLITEKALGVMLQASSSKSLCRPTTINIGFPMKELNPWRCPVLLDHFPRLAVH
jgi:hypothetical protein